MDNLLKADNNQQSGEVVNRVASQVISRKVSKKKDNFHAVREKDGNIYRKQLNRGVDTMRKAIEYALNQVALEYTPNRFLADYGRLVERLLDSKRFEKDCERLHVEPFNVATHIVFDGIKQMNAVLADGLDKVCGSRLTEFREAVYSKEELCAALGYDLAA